MVLTILYKCIACGRLSVGNGYNLKVMYGKAPLCNECAAKTAKAITP